jgi:hypothetical protein
MSVASGDRSARVHALRALDSHNDGDHESASDAHDKAARRHQRLADDSEDPERDAHQRVADAHPRASSMHRDALGATLNAAGHAALTSNAAQEAAAEAVLNEAFDRSGDCAGRLNADVLARRYEELKGRLPGGGRLPNDKLPIARLC